MRYAITIKPDDNGTLLVACADLPEVITFGDTIQAARSHAADAIQTAITARLKAGADIPEPKSDGDVWVTIS